MNKLLISYDLIAPGRNYEPLWDFLKSQGSWAKPLQSLYLIKTGQTASSIRDEIIQYLDTNDKVYVVDITSKSSAWHNLPDAVSKWIKNN